jgi:hypothetical protein
MTFGQMIDDLQLQSLRALIWSEVDNIYKPERLINMMEKMPPEDVVKVLRKFKDECIAIGRYQGLSGIEE